MATSTQRSRSRRLPAVLFAAASVVFAISLCSPAVQSTSTHVMPGDDVFLTTFRLTFFPWMWIELFGSGDYLFISIPSWLTLIMGTFANVILIVAAIAGWRLRRRATAMCYLAACGLLAGLLMPIVGVAGGWADGNPRDMYDALYYGYWLWIASLALVAAGWGSIVWNQRQLRNDRIRSDATVATTTQPPSGV
jgi:hypothetical protein